VAASFSHLHVHTEYSMLDGASRIDELVAAVAADGQPAVGITDHGNMYGVLPFYKACKAQGVTPVIGSELYMAHDRRDERALTRGRPRAGGTVDDTGGDAEEGRKAWYHLTVLAEDYTGYRNLIQLSSRAFLEGYYRKPKVDWELLADHSEGVIATTGCLGGHVLQSLLNGDAEAALAKAARLQDIFGRDNLFVELQDHGIAEQHKTNPQLVDIARKIKAPLLATNDSHYTRPEDAEAHDALLCVQTAALISQGAEERFKFKGEGHYLKSAQEMRHLFRDHEEACDNSLWIAERANVEIEFGTPQLPDFELPAGFTDDAAYLRHLTFEGARARWGDQLDDVTVERLAFELQVIGDMGFSAYFLITWDLIRHARDAGIRVGPGRGSAAGSAVAYSLRITDLDPIRYDLLFERFLNPSRISMPDIDMDFDSRYRDEMIRYAAERYGRDRVAQIITFGTIKARQAVRDAARVLGYPYAVGDKVAKAMPPLVMGRDTPLYACLAPHPGYDGGYKMASELRAMYDTDPDITRIVDVATGLEGMRRSDGIHAAAVVITKEPLTDYLPIQRKPEAGQAPEDAPIVTQYEMNGVEELGLLKMDFLGLRNLDVIADAVTLVESFRGVAIDIDAVALDDEPTLELLRRGDSIGVFQLEGTNMRALMRSLAPTSFEDVAALVALYRPGPMAANMHNDYADRKNGRQAVTYLHPDAEEILGSTYGLCIYQEQVMRVAQRFAGFSLAEADNLRKAMGKKKREVMAKEKEKFVSGCITTGYGAKLGETWFGIIEQFADYAFGKAHSYGYGFIAFQTAFLKANFPVEYLAALLTSVRANFDKAAVYLAECRTMGIEVLVPDVNRSQSDFVPARLPDGSEGIPFGMAAIRNVGTALVGLIVAEREARGPYVDFLDFCDRVPLTVLNKKTLESLVKAGAFDSLGHARLGLLETMEDIVDKTLARRREHDMGVMTLFGSSEDGNTGYDDRPAIGGREFDKRTKLAFEKEMLGLYVSDHPLLGAEAALRRRTDGTIAEVAEADDGSIRVVGGVITALSRKWTRAGDQMAVFCLEDLTTTIEVMVFPKAMTMVGHKLADDAVVLVKARVDHRDEQAKLVAIDVEAFDGVPDGAPPVRLQVAPGALSDAVIGDLKRLLVDHPGESPVFLHIGDNRVLRLPDDCCVDVTNGFAGEVRALLGADCLL
jgi:DNA polymerase-3 subunit alpha